MSVAWKMVGVTFFTQFLAMGFTFYSFSILLKPIAAEFDTARTSVAMLATAMSLAGAVMAPFVGKWVVRSPIRNIMSLGCIVMGVGFLLASRTTSLWQLGILFGTLLSFGVATMGGVTSQALVVNWFAKDRTLALGISMMGISASGVLMAYSTTALVEAGGWRWAFEVFGWITLCATPIVWAMVIGHPDELDGEIDTSESAQSQAQTTDEPVVISTRDALRERNLWVIALVCGLAFMGTTAVMIHIVAFGTDIGLDAGQAAGLLAALAAGAAAGKIAFSWLANRVGEQRALYVAIVMEGLGIAALAISMPFPAFVLLALMLGLGVGGVMPLAAALLARAFGPEAFGPMMGLMTPLMILFQMTGAPFAAAVYDSTGSYHGAWYTMAALLLVACGLLSLLKLEDKEQLDLPGAAGQQA